MIWAEVHRRGYQAAVLGLAVFATACATSPRTSPVAVMPCDREHTDFMTATGFYAAPQSLADPAAAAPDGIVSLNTDARAADAALTQLTGAFASLAACRTAMADADKARSALAYDLDNARAALAEAALIEAAEAERLDRLTAIDSASAQTAAAAIRLPRPKDQAFITISGGEIYDRADATSARIALLREGERVTAPSDVSVGGIGPDWQAINLNDGSIGYVRTASLRLAPVRIEAGASASGGTQDGLAATTSIIRQILPQKRMALAAMLSGTVEVETNTVAASPMSNARN